MSDATIPKEQLTAYERWELPHFDTAQQGGSHFTPSPQGQRRGVLLPTATQLEQLHRQVHEEGYQAGYAAGAQAAAQETQRLAGLVQTMQQALQQADQQIAQELLAVALEVSRQMLQHALKVKPELILNVINAALSNLPQFSQGAHLVMHPDDAALVRDRMGEQLAHSGWKIFEDARIERGGLRVETAHSQIDATLASRWQHITTALGQDHSWLQE
ncbi:MAG TPA: flagellar assembly protein FliH [Gallionellaceae bacterium]|nr:flagellar assembly protein FliH [Gallionellaceae bacterium]